MLGDAAALAHAAAEPFAEVGDGVVRVDMGWLGRAELNADNVARLSRMPWPWWAGIGVRLGRKMVAYTTSWGDAAVIELTDPVDVRAPLKWTTARVVVGVADVDEFLRAVAHVPGAPGGGRSGLARSQEGQQTGRVGAAHELARQAP